MLSLFSEYEFWNDLLTLDLELIKKKLLYIINFT